MQQEERQKRIEEYIVRNEFASLEQLATCVGVSIATVRRDLAALDGHGTVRRTHGGARLIVQKPEDFSFSSRDTQQLEEKEAIASTCADLIRPNQTVIIDAGTTCFHVARFLESKSPHVITNSLPVAHLFSGAQRMEVVVSGGLIYPRLGVLVGPLAVLAFAQVHADVAIMSCGGISAEGIFNSHGLLIEIQRAMILAATRIILCVDHTKFGQQSISRLCALDEVDVLVCDQMPPTDILSALRACDVEIIVAELGGNTRPSASPRMRELVTTVEKPPAPPASTSVLHGFGIENDQFVD